MNSKDYNKKIADARRNVSRKFGFRQSSYINFKVEAGYFFCLYFLTDEARLTVKPMYADELWWDIWDATENKNEPLSLRGIGAYSLSGQMLASYKITETTDDSKLVDMFERVFNATTAEISIFLTINPDADKFFPDEAKMDHDPDRLLYLIALIHNGREEEVLAIIKDARQNKHSCMFHSGMFGDSYTYIRRWCNRGQVSGGRMRHVLKSYFDTIVKLRAYALMALGCKKNDIEPNMWYFRAFDFGIISALFVSINLLCENFTLACIVSALYLILVYSIDFMKRSTHYCVRFGKLPDKTRLKWKVNVWIVVTSLYLYTFAILFLNLI